MIKYDVKFAHCGLVNFTAEIDCPEGAPEARKLAGAVEWALNNNVGLQGCDFSGAHLFGINLSRANIAGCKFAGANLVRANLRGANAYGANFGGADLRRSCIDGANLSWAIFARANLSECGMCQTNIHRTVFAGANFTDADLEGVSGLNDWVKCIQIDQYPITYTDKVLQIGCQRHLISEWAEFDDRRILEMDGKDALRFWRKSKRWIFKTIELSPAKSTAIGAGQ